jgi:hypothetical protein
MPCRWASAVILVLGVVSLAWLTPAASAQAPSSPAPTLTVSVAPTPVTLEVRKGHLWDTRSTAGHATGSLVLSLQSSNAAWVDVTGLYSDGTASSSVSASPSPPPSASPPAGTPPSAIGVDPNAAVRVDVSFDWSHTSTNSGWLVFTDSSHQAPALVVPFQLKETIPAAVLEEVLGLAAAGAVIMILLAWRRLGGEHKVTAGPTWSFKDSWATNLAAAGAILGTILGTSGLVSEVMPGLSTGMIVGFSLVYAFLVALAPVVFQALYRQDKPTYFGLLVAGWVVLWAVLGELGTLYLLLIRGGASPCWGLLGLPVLIFVYLYAKSSTSQAIAAPKPAAVDVAVAATSAAASAAALAVAAGKGDVEVRDAASRAAKDVVDAAGEKLAVAPVAPGMGVVVAAERPAALL